MRKNRTFWYLKFNVCCFRRGTIALLTNMEGRFNQEQIEIICLIGWIDEPSAIWSNLFGIYAAYVLCNFVGNLPPSFDDYTGTPENLDKETWEFQPSRTMDIQQGRKLGMAPWKAGLQTEKELEIQQKPKVNQERSWTHHKHSMRTSRKREDLKERRSCTEEKS